MTGQKKLNIFFVAAEVAPFASVGGLSQVMYFLPKTLHKLGHDVRIFMPKYGTIDEHKHHIKPLISGLKVPTGETKGVTELICNIKIRQVKDEPTIYFLENMEYFERRANVYGYTDDPVRFALLSRGAIEFLRTQEWTPDVVHSNDWHTGYLGNYIRKSYADDEKLKKIALLFTIHNLALQGPLDFNILPPSEFDSGRGALSSFFSERLRKQNALKRGIIYSDMVNTVSERYSREIMTPEYGQGMQDLLKEMRAKVFGVLNGLDYEDFDPSTDPLIKKKYSLKDIDSRVENKIDLQEEFDLPVNPDIPIVGIVGRLDPQKGIDLVMKILEFALLEFEFQFIILGEGEHRYREFFTKLEAKFPKQVRTHLMANWQLPRKIFAGSDIFMLPSRFEPGGIVVIEAMRYGAVPIVRATGGLSDSVSDFNLESGKGTGFRFKKYHELSLFGSLAKALELYKSKKIWRQIVANCMHADFSWDASAVQYTKLYERAIDFRRESLAQNPAPAYRGIT